jgi:hypothetical protein
VEHHHTLYLRNRRGRQITSNCGNGRGRQFRIEHCIPRCEILTFARHSAFHNFFDLKVRLGHEPNMSEHARLGSVDESLFSSCSVQQAFGRALLEGSQASDLCGCHS